MLVVIAEEEVWRERGRGNRLDVLRAYLEDKDDYMRMLVSFMERYEARSFIDPVVFTEYAEPDDEFSYSGTIPLIGAVIESLDVPAEFNTFCEITGDRVDFVVHAYFTDTSDPDYFTGRDRYCPVSFRFETLQRLPAPPARLGIVVEPVVGNSQCLQ